jgi:hypothetical protein
MSRSPGCPLRRTSYSTSTDPSGPDIEARFPSRAVAQTPRFGRSPDGYGSCTALSHIEGSSIRGEWGRGGIRSRKESAPASTDGGLTTVSKGADPGGAVLAGLEAAGQLVYGSCGAVPFTATDVSRGMWLAFSEQ